MSASVCAHDVYKHLETLFFFSKSPLTRSESISAPYCTKGLLTSCQCSQNCNKFDLLEHSCMSTCTA